MTSTHVTDPPKLVRNPDLLLGMGAVVVGGVVLAYALTLPTMGDGMPGPGLFPGIISSALILFGIAQAIKTIVVRRRSAAADDAEQPDEQIVEMQDRTADEPDETAAVEVAAPGLEVEQETISSRRAWVNGVVMLTAIVGYMALAETLGFIISMFLVSFIVMWLLNAKIVSSIVTSLVLSFGLWLIFEEGLQVQLPDGLLW